MKKNILAGYDNLLNPTPTAPAAQEQAPTEKVRGNYKTVCYSINPDVAEKMRYIARYDRKKLNEVVTEAFAAYIAAWKPTNEKPLKF